MNKPTIGRIVLYRTDGRNGLSYDLPAIVNCTIDTHPGDYPDGKANPLPVPDSDMHVHLTVFTPGGFGSEIRTKDARYSQVGPPESDKDWKGATAFIPGSGTYVEWNVPFDSNEFSSNPNTKPNPRSWRWPVIK